jgi:hypothetical protein|tara:strand:- start:836 stop:1030 length:195 start_codon:yes stop_codon:yes gene_type:complete
MNKYAKFIKQKLRIKNTQPATIYFDDRDDVTDEIERSLLEMKDLYDFPTEEIEKAIDSRRKSKK